MENRIRERIEALCSDECSGRKPGTKGGLLARDLVKQAFQSAGLQVVEQPVEGSGACNLLAALPGRTNRWVVVGAHYDHLGAAGGEVFRGADDNAAAVAVLLEVASALAAR